MSISTSNEYSNSIHDLFAIFEIKTNPIATQLDIIPELENVVEMRLKEVPYENKVFVATIENNSIYEIFTHHTSYSLEYFNGEFWMEVPFYEWFVFTDLSSVIQPMSEYDIFVRLDLIPNLKGGLYRIRKNVSLSDKYLAPNHDLIAEFNLLEN